MKTNTIFLLILTVSLILTSCTSDNESIQPEMESLNPQDILIPMESLAKIGAVEIAGLPKMLKKFENGILTYWAQYYYRPDGNILKVNYGYSSSSSDMFSDNYLYNNEGKLIKLDGHDIYNFYWNEGRIVEANRYNGMWYGQSEIFYEYNSIGQIIQKLEINIDFNFQEKKHYTYSEGGNLKSIDEHGDYDGSGVFIPYKITNYGGYGEDVNLFPEVQIIPGISTQNNFPYSMEFKHLTTSGYDVYEIYSYEYVSDGKVTKKTYGNNMVIYDYY